MLGYVYWRLVKIRPDFHSCLIFPFSDLEKLGSVCMAFYTCGITDLILVSSILLFGYRQMTPFCRAYLWAMTKGHQLRTRPHEQEDNRRRKWSEKQWRERQNQEEGRGWTTPLQHGIAREESRMLAVTFYFLQDWFSQGFCIPVDTVVTRTTGLQSPEMKLLETGKYFLSSTINPAPVVAQGRQGRGVNLEMKSELCSWMSFHKPSVLIWQKFCYPSGDFQWEKYCWASRLPELLRAMSPAGVQQPGLASGQHQLSCSCVWEGFSELEDYRPSLHPMLCVCDLPSKFLWALGCSFIKMSFFPNSRRWLQNMLKFVFHSLGLPELCAHLSYVIFLSICGFEVMVSEMLTPQVKSWAKTKFFLEEILTFPLVPHNWKTWKWIHGNWSLLWSKCTSAKLRPHGKC